MKKYLILVLLLLTLWITGCTKDNVSTSNSEDGTSQNPVTENNSGQTAETTLVLNGSVTALPIMLGLSDGFSGSQDGAVQFDVAAIGKNTSIDAIVSGDAELAVFEGSLSDIPAMANGEAVAYEAVAVIVNPAVGVDNLSSQDILSIFSGESNDWSDFGGNGAINIIMPEDKDSFRQFFEETFSLRGSVNGIMKSLIPEDAVISADPEADVMNTEGAIGICQAALLNNGDSTVSIDSVPLSEETLSDGSYIASCSIMLLINKEASQDARGFYDYCLSDQGEAVLSSIGYTPVR